MNDHHNITKELEALRPALRDSERAMLWQRIAPNLGIAVPSPYARTLHKKGVVAVMIVIVMLTASGTVAAAQPARPGDFLFPVDTATERALLFVSPETRRAALKERFTEERFGELESLMNEAVVSVDDGVLAWNSAAELEIEADVFTDITVVKVELNDNTRYLTMSATTKEYIAAAVAARYGLPYDSVVAAIEFSIEDRASRPRDRGALAPERQNDIAFAVGVVLDQIDDHDEDVRREFVSRFMDEYESITPLVSDERIMRFKAQFDEDDEDEYEMRSENDRIRIDDDQVEIRSEGLRVRYEDDGTVEVKEDDDNGGSDDTDERENSNDDSNDSEDRDEDKSDDDDREESDDDNSGSDEDEEKGDNNRDDELDDDSDDEKDEQDDENQ